MFLNNKLIFCTIIFLEILLLSQQVDFDPNVNCKAILIDTKIIYIIDLDNNYNIYLYDSSQNKGNQIGTIDTNYINHKRIIKSKRNEFIIIGLSSNDYFYYEIYEFTGSEVNLKKKGNSGFQLNTLKYFEGKYISDISENKIIVSTNTNNIFKIYMIDLDTGTYKEKKIEDSEYLNQETYFKRNIDCDSSGGNTFFCIFCYKGDDIWKLFYIRGEFGATNKISGNVCDDCFLGNIIKENQSANRYLICYQQKSNSLLSIVCQYYTYSEGRLIIGNNYEVGKITGDFYDNKPLILYKHESSILIIFNYSSNNVYFSISILCSLDLKINIITILHTGKSDITMNSFNDNDYFYSLYEETDTDNINKSTKLKMFQLKQCLTTDSIVLSDDVKVPINFGYEHSGQIITFSLDTKILLYRDIDKDIIVSPNGNNYITLENNEKFEFVKLEESGVFENYYCYMKKGKLYDFLSLICKITVTICYSSCKSCNPNKISSSEGHLCKECKNNYYPLYADANKAEHNCYSPSDAKVASYYLETKNSKRVFSPCNSSCKTCDNDHSCKTCKDGYYFKYENNDIKTNDICYTSQLENYYLDYNSINKVYNGETIRTVYKPCYDSCSSCIGEGTYDNNNCITCKTGKQYKFNAYQCIQDKQNCINDNKYWEIKRNNIDCLDNCDKKIILYGENRGLCVDDCLNYINPEATITNYFTLINCGGKNYCIPVNICLNGHFNYNVERSECVRIGDCEIDPFINDDPFEHDDDPIPDDPPVDITPNEKIDEINKRFKVFKMFRESKKYTSWHYFDSQLIQNYIRLLKKELENYENSEIYLITTTEYDNFTITIYPLDIEEFVYNQIFIPNNLGFVNFTNTFTNFIDYEINKRCLILIILLESHAANSSINDINYYFYALNEKKDDGNNEIKIKEDNYLTSKNSLFEISYPLYNHHDNTSNINKRNSEDLVDNIKSMYYKYPNIELYNLQDPFYNDICSIYTSEVNTDMTLNDRRKEYYVNQTLCENNCYLIKILNTDLKNPRALCNCNIKKEFMYNNKKSINYSIPEISSYNSKSVKCISETFNKNSISSNPIFWIFMIVIIFLIILLIRWIFYGKKEINRILQLYKQNPDDSNIKISINDNTEFNDISNIDNKDNSKKNKSKFSKIDKKKDLSRSMAIKDNRVQYSNNAIDSQQAEYLSAPINQSAPPKRKIQKIAPNLLTKDEYKTDDKDLISNSEPSIFKNSNKPNEKDNTDISFENVPYDNQIYVDNLLKQRKMMENNYLKNPVEFEKNQKMEILKNTLYNLEDFEQKKYCNTCEDIYCPKKVTKNGNTKKNEKNKLILKLLDAESLFDKENDPFNNNNLSDNNEETKLQKNKDKNNDNNINSIFFKDEKIEGDEQFYFPGGIFGKDGENLLITNDINSQKNWKNKNVNKKKRKFNEINEDNKNNDNNNESDNENDNDKNNVNDNNAKKNKSNNKNKKNSNNYNSSNDNNINNSNKNNSNNQNSNNKNQKNNKKNKGKDTSKTINANAKNNLLKSLGKNNFYEDDNNNEEKKDGKDENNNEKLKTEFDQDANNKIKTKLKKIASGEDNSEEGIFNKYKNTLISDDKNNNKFKKSYNSNILKIKSKKYNSKDNKYNKNDSSRESNSNRKMINFPQEIEKEGDMGVPITDSNILRKKNDNNEDEISDKISVDKKSNDNKSDFEMFKNKILASSVSAFIDTEENKPILVEEKFLLFYWRYFKKRELCFVCFNDKNDTIPYFVRWSCFAFCLIFIFLLSCLFFFESNVHKRYINALNGKKNRLGYYFKNEFSNSFFVALISIIFKMIIIKIVLYRLLKIKKDDKKMMKASSEKGLNEIQLEELLNKRNKFIKIYKIKLLVYFVSLMVLSILFSYFCICYGGVFRNSISAFLLGFLFSSILTFILCALICLIIVGIYRLAKYLKNKCILSTYIVLSTLY